MVRKIECECAERYEAKIDTWKLYQEIKDFFDDVIKLDRMPMGKHSVPVDRVLRHYSMTG